MKHLFENWRRFIKEDEQQEFGSGLEKTLASCDGLDNGFIGQDHSGASTGCLEEKGFELKAEGGFRNVYLFPGSVGKQYVLKVANDRKLGPRMNELEADYNMQSKYGELVPKTYKHSDDYKWMVVERVFPWKGSDEGFIRKFFPALANKDLIKTTNYPSMSVWEFFEEVSMALRENIKEGDEGKNSDFNRLFISREEGQGKGSSEKNRMGYERRVAFEKTLSPLYKRFIDLSTEYNVEFWDILAKNVGTRSDGSFVILDLSVFEE